MTLIHHTYGKARVRVLRVNRDGDRHEVREATVKAMLEGDAFGRAYTGPDNSAVVATDSIKNIVNVTAREQLAAQNEAFGIAVARRFLDRYPQVERVNITVVETRWQRLSFDGQPHPHSFTPVANGKPFARIRATRDATEVESGIEGFTFLKSTGSGWMGYVHDEFTTLAETTDRICATSMDASWHYDREPADFAAANDKILQTMLRVFATTYSEGVQDSLYRMGQAALEAVPEISRVSMAAPNKHYIPINLSHFGLDNNNQVFLPTDEPHGQIECTVGRG